MLRGGSLRLLAHETTDRLPHRLPLFEPALLDEGVKQRYSFRVEIADQSPLAFGDASQS